MTADTCRYCGCTMDRACAGRCFWIEREADLPERKGPLCSTCADLRDDLISYLVHAGPGPHMVRTHVILQATTEALEMIHSQRIDGELQSLLILEHGHGLRLTADDRDERAGFTIEEVARMFNIPPQWLADDFDVSAAAEYLDQRGQAQLEDVRSFFVSRVRPLIGEATGMEVDEPVGAVTDDTSTISAVVTRINSYLRRNSTEQRWHWEAAISIDKDHLLEPMDAMDAITRQVNRSWIQAAVKTCRRALGKVKSVDRDQPQETRVRGDGTRYLYVTIRQRETEDGLPWARKKAIVGVDHFERVICEKPLRRFSVSPGEIGELTIAAPGDIQGPKATSQFADDYNPFEPPETPEQRARRVGQIIRENVDKISGSDS